MGRPRSIVGRKQNPSVKIDLTSHERLKAEAEILSRGQGKIEIGGLASLIFNLYFENKDLFRDVSSGIIGTQPEWEVERSDTGPTKAKEEVQKSLFSKESESRSAIPAPN